MQSPSAFIASPAESTARVIVGKPWGAARIFYTLLHEPADWAQHSAATKNHGIAVSSDAAWDRSSRRKSSADGLSENSVRYLFNIFSMKNTTFWDILPFSFPPCFRVRFSAASFWGCPNRVPWGGSSDEFEVYWLVHHVFFQWDKSPHSIPLHDLSC